MAMYEEPRQARVSQQKFLMYGERLLAMGLKKQEFLAVGEENGGVIVHPDDLRRPSKESFTLNREIVEFLES